MMQNTFCNRHAGMYFVIDFDTALEFMEEYLRIRKQFKRPLAWRTLVAGDEQLYRPCGKST